LYQDRTQLHIAQLFLSGTLLLVRIAKMELSVFTSKKNGAVSQDSREESERCRISEEVVAVICFFLFYKQVLSFYVDVAIMSQVEKRCMYAIF
jgi:hypothetical protein